MWTLCSLGMGAAELAGGGGLLMRGCGPHTEAGMAKRVAGFQGVPQPAINSWLFPCLLFPTVQLRCK